MTLPALRRSAFVAAALTAVAAVSIPVAGAAVADHHVDTPKPTVVFVHGAFADASGWYGAMDNLRKDGYPVRAANNPLRGLPSDAAYVRDFLNSINGPIILVGHSYGGAVITQAAAGDPDVKALVYVAASVPDVGESLADLKAHQVDDPAPALPLQLVKFTEPDGSQGTDAYIDRAKFRDTFAGDVNPTVAADMADSQKGIDLAALNQKATAAAWKTIPSWFLIAKQDHANSTNLQRWEAERIGAHAVEIDSSHAAMVSHPEAVSDLVEQADRGTN
ncbi:pimeloyl-ACP methyl ester carboxylesterase [Streptomyces sp. SAI-135]|uniref:alpha/beta fold hydrolase n=1 Tax=unclassified Streptomyces TaxID=2593676 RepID=UPI002474C3AD|nr:MULTISPECIES: alpha/beta hydrolase [unclassified Streptomyces]MDH6522886.1 pimeloyl-ACP methyl ester carboxylesterase [Streptomyces sp. SAI-090]MDH6613500.1 pimeloyl-ACP methyl ester carboxylesterase [Streptomyces sp. SAI-135]